MEEGCLQQLKTKTISINAEGHPAKGELNLGVSNASQSSSTDPNEVLIEPEEVSIDPDKVYAGPQFYPVLDHTSYPGQYSYLHEDLVLIPEIRRVAWAEYSEVPHCTCGSIGMSNLKRETTKEIRDNYHKAYAIDVLVGKPGGNNKPLPDDPGAAAAQRLIEIPTSSAKNDIVPVRVVVPEIPNRIRINAESIKDLILDGRHFVGSMTLLHPFRVLVDNEKNFRTHFRKLELACQMLETVRRDDGVGGDTESAKKVHDEGEETRRVFKEISCLIEFLDSDLSPVLNLHRQASLTHVRFRDLWFLFRDGQLITSRTGHFASQTSKPDSLDGASTRLPRTWKIMQTAGGRLRPRTTRVMVESKQTWTPFRVLAYCIDFDGDGLWPVGKVHEIAPFEGERTIQSLDIVPLSYRANSSELTALLLNNGRYFLECIDRAKNMHRRYDGLTLTTHHDGSRCSAAAELSEHISGDVIVDFREARQKNPHWVKKSTSLTQLDVSQDNVSGESPIIISSARARDQKCVQQYLDPEFYKQWRLNILIEEDPFLGAFARLISGGACAVKDLSEEDYLILPQQVCAFVLQRRSFALLSCDSLSSIRTSEKGWNELHLPNGRKDMILAQAQRHFRNKADTQVYGRDGFDIIEGKGQGLIILLHGYPGVGKSSTAECIAAKLGYPLYPITCGDLGTTAIDVDRELNQVFSRAQKWNCVLLLDEADVFLAERDRRDIKRNALVSVFLRTLEYYNGLLFLTTNRVGHFDDAFKSRIHLALHYAPLTEKQYKRIWKTNLAKVHEVKGRKIQVDEDEILAFAKRLYLDPTMTWNGRQIRNAFQTAIALAEFEVSGSDADVVNLTDKHFEKVARTMNDFENYITDGLYNGKDETQRAFSRRERNDHFEDDLETSWDTRYNAKSRYEEQSSRPRYSGHAASSDLNRNLRAPHSGRRVESRGSDVRHSGRKQRDLEESDWEDEQNPRSQTLRRERSRNHEERAGFSTPSTKGRPAEMSSDSDS